MNGRGKNAMRSVGGRGREREKEERGKSAVSNSVCVCVDKSVQGLRGWVEAVANTRLWELVVQARKEERARTHTGGGELPV